MIYRSWSLLTSTAVVTSGIIGAVVVGNLLFVHQDPFLKRDPKKTYEATSK